MIKIRKRQDRVGIININQQGFKMEIIKYRTNKDIDILFENEYIAKSKTYYYFKNGKINNPYYKSIFGVGFIGDGEYNSLNSATLYTKWYNMIGRCYSKKVQIKQSSYIGCSVCSEWHNFQNFAKWFNNNIWSEECNVVDKDILVKRNKIYSPDTCILVDININSLFTKCDKSRSDCPIGVHKIKGRITGNNYIAECSMLLNKDNNKRTRYLGVFKTPIEAFNAYKQFKESYIKQVADDYANKYSNFPKRLYDAMYNYEVEITD